MDSQSGEIENPENSAKIDKFLAVRPIATLGDIDPWI
jgi:hypothetical protein